MGTAELLTTATETHDQADIVESSLLLPSTTKTPDLAKPKTKSLQVSVRKQKVLIWTLAKSSYIHYYSNTDSN